MQPRLITKESNKKQSILSAKFHLVEVKAPVDVTWKTMTYAYANLEEKKFTFSFSSELKLRRLWTFFRPINPSFWLSDTYLDSSTKHGISRSELARAPNYFVFSSQAQ